MRRHRHRTAGITLVELAVTLLVISILASVGVVSYITFVRQSTVDVATAELQSLWNDVRATAQSQERAPAAVAPELVEQLNQNSQFLVVYEPDPPSVITWDPDPENPLCVRAVLPVSNNVQRAPSGACDTVLLDTMENANVAGWWPLDSGNANAGTGPDAVGTGITYDQEPAAVHARTDGDDASATGGNLRVDDATDLTDASAGLTIGLWVNTYTTATLAQVGESAPYTARLHIDGTGNPQCEAGNATTTASGWSPTEDWHLFTCRVHPNGDVSVLVDGQERSRASGSNAPDLTPPAVLYPAGSNDGTFNGGFDHPFVATQTISDAALRTFALTATTELPDRSE